MQDEGKWNLACKNQVIAQLPFFQVEEFESMSSLLSGDSKAQTRWNRLDAARAAERDTLAKKTLPDKKRNYQSRNGGGNDNGTEGTNFNGKQPRSVQSQDCRAQAPVELEEIKGAPQSVAPAHEIPDEQEKSACSTGSLGSGDASSLEGAPLELPLNGHFEAPDNKELNHVHEEHGVESWDLKGAQGGALSNGRLTFIKSTEDGWNCCLRGTRGWESGVHEWDIHLQCKMAVSFGVSQKDISFVDADANSKIRYDLYCHRNIAMRSDGTEDCCFSRRKRVPLGSNIMIKLDLDNHTVTYGLNEKWNLSPTFTGLDAAIKWFPYFAVFAHNCEFTVFPRNENKNEK